MDHLFGGEQEQEALDYSLVISQDHRCQIAKEHNVVMLGLEVVTGYVYVVVCFSSTSTQTDVHYTEFIVSKDTGKGSTWEVSSTWVEYYF